MTTDREYVLGTDPAELDRLGLQHRAWRAQAYDHWERAGFAPGQHLVDVGCGPGFATLDLARLVGPAGRVTAVDVSRPFLEHVERAAAREGLTNIARVASDVQTLPLEPASADGAWCRWVLSFVPDPGAVIAGVARALAPGGVFAIQEYVSYDSFRLGPSGPALRKVAAAVQESWRARGGEADVGLRLPTLLAKHDLHVTSLRPICRIAQPGSLLWDWPGSFFTNYVPKLVAMGLLTEADRVAFEAEWREATDDPDALMVCPTVVEIIAAKA